MVTIEDLIGQVVRDIRSIEDYARGKSYEERATLDNRKYGFVCTLGRLLLGVAGEDITNTDHATYAARDYLASH